MNGESLLVVDDLRMHLVFKTSVAEVVDGVSLIVRKGEALGVVGESGSGKSMFALSLIGLAPQPYGKIVGGRVSFAGADLLDPRQAASIVGKRIGVIFENPGASLDPCYRIGDQINETIRIHESAGKQTARQRVLELLGLVGIADPPSAYSAYPHQLSGGMQQRVMIAIALACRPELLIADNPTSALDVTIQAQIVRLVQDLRARFGLTLIWITHNLGIVTELCDRVAFMYAGKIVEYGSRKAILKDGLFHPYTIGLLRLLPRIHHQGELVPMAGTPPNPAALEPGCRFAPRCPRVMDACRSGEVVVEDVGDDHWVRCLLARRSS